MGRGRGTGAGSISPRRRGRAGSAAAVPLQNQGAGGGAPASVASSGEGPAAGAVRGPYKWTEERLEAELRRIVAAEGRIPTNRELNRRGLSALRKAITTYGGTTYWAKRLGVELVASQDRVPIEEAAYRRQLAEVLARHGAVGHGALRELGYSRLASYVARNGGTKKVAERFGLPARR